MPDDEVVEPAKAGSSKKGRLVPIVVVAMLMGLEGVGVFFLAKVINPAPTPTMGADMMDNNGSGSQDEDNLVEVEVAECRPSNKISGKFITFHIRVLALVAASDQDKVEKLLRARRARVEDGVNTVIRSAEPNHLTEPSRNTIKRLLKEELNRILGDDQLIIAILIPQMLQSGPGV